MYGNDGGGSGAEGGGKRRGRYPRDRKGDGERRPALASRRRSRRARRVNSTRGARMPHSHDPAQHAVGTRSHPPQNEQSGVCTGWCGLRVTPAAHTVQERTVETRHHHRGRLGADAASGPRAVPLLAHMCKTRTLFGNVWPTRSQNGTARTDRRSDESRMDQLDAPARDPEVVAHPPPR